MKTIPCFVAVALVLALTSCGGGGPPPEKTKTKDAESKKTDSSAPAASKTSEPVKTSEAPKTAEPAKTDASKTGAAAPAPPVAATAQVTLPKDFKDDDGPGGKRISAWLMDLNSDTKTTLVEALNACEIIGKNAKPGLARIESLTKNPDKEIAEAAEAALKSVK